jgi:hypothetical protein
MLAGIPVASHAIEGLPIIGAPDRPQFSHIVSGIAKVVSAAEH